MEKETINSIEKASLRIFLLCMFLCAISAIVAIWLDWFEVDPQIVPIIPTLFIIGLASFLVWLPIIIYGLIETLKDRG